MAQIIEPCGFPPALGGYGTCSFADLNQARPLVNGNALPVELTAYNLANVCFIDMCNFFNATLYTGYAGCPNELSPLKTLGVIARENVQVTH